MSNSTLKKLIRIDCPNCWRPIDATFDEVLEGELSCGFCSCDLPNHSHGVVKYIISQPDFEQELDKELREGTPAKLLEFPEEDRHLPITHMLPVRRIPDEDYESIRCPGHVNERILSEILVGKAEYKEPKLDLEHPLLVKTGKLLNDGNHQYAEIVARKLIKRFPRETRAHLALANVLSAKGATSESEQHLLTAWTSVAQPGFLLARIGREAWKEERREEAFVWWSKACAVQAATPHQADAFPLTILEMVCWGMGDQRAADNFGIKADVAFFIGDSREFDQADYDLARHVGEWVRDKEMKLDPRETWARYVYAVLHLLDTYRGRQDYEFHHMPKDTDGIYLDPERISRGSRVRRFEK